MLSKNKIDKKLRNYIKEHLGKGYTKHAVKHVLVNHGYDELYIDSLLRRQSELEFVKKYAFIVSLLFVLSIFSLNILPKETQNKITGYAINSNKYFVLDVNHFDGSVTFNSIKLGEFDNTIESSDKSGFLIKTVSFGNEDIETVYYNMVENKNYLLYVPYNENAAKIEMYDFKNSRIMEIDVSSYSSSGQKITLEEDSNEKPSYLIWILIISVVLIILLFFLIKKIQKNKIINSLKQYINENIRKGFTEQQIKTTLLRSGYKEKEVEKAMNSI